MSEANENFLLDFAQKFKIGQNLPASEHIKLLKNLEKLDSKKLVLVVNYFLTIENNLEVLAYFIKTIGRFQDELTLEIVSEMLLSDKFSQENENTTRLKCEIINCLGHSGNTSYVLPILYVLNNKDENYKIRLTCAEALGRIGSSYAVAPLINVVTDNEEKSMYLRESAAKALGMLGDIRAIEPLANVLENRNGLFDKFSFLKERIVEALGRLGQYGDDKSIKALKNALEDESACVRIGAIEALSSVEDEKVIPLIEKMIDDENEEVARTAIFTLYEISGLDYVKELSLKRKLPECCIDEISDLISDTEVIEVEKKNEQ